MKKYGNKNSKIDDVKQFKSEFATSLYNVMKYGADAPYFRDIELFQGEDSDQIECGLRMDLAQRRACDIRDWEYVRFVIPYDKRKHIKVYALRFDFPKHLIHTNRTPEGYPIDICYTEDERDEQLLNLTPNKLIASLRDWFKDQAEGTIHKEDQPLEPFFSTGLDGICDERLLKKRGVIDLLVYVKSSTSFFIDPSKKKFAPTGSDLMKLKTVCLDAMPVVQKDISSNSTTVGQFSKQITLESGHTLFDMICELVSKSNSINHQQTVALVIIRLPIKRDESSESEKVLNYTCIVKPSNQKDCGRLNQVLKKRKLYRNDKVLIANIVKDFPLYICSMQDDFNTELAAKCNGFNDADYDDNQYSIIGVGALGSQLMTSLARMEATEKRFYLLSIHT